MTQPDESDGMAGMRARATSFAITTMEAHDDPEVLELYSEACDAVAKYGQAMYDRGVPITQMFGQLQGVANAVLFRALRLSDLGG